MHPRRLHRGVTGLLLVAAASCEVVDRARNRDVAVDTAAAPAAGRTLVLRMETPGILRPGQEGTVRVSVTNRGDTVAHGVRLELFVPGWLEPVAPRAGARDVTMSSAGEEGYRLSYQLDTPPIQPGRTETVEQRIRIPANSPTTKGALPWSHAIRARLSGPGGQAGAEVESSVRIDTATAGDSARVRDAPGDAPRRDRVGPLALGMTAAALRQAASGARDTSWRREGTTERGQVVHLGRNGRAIAVLSGDTVVRIEVRDTVTRTREGLGVGSRFEELGAAYGRACAGAAEGEVVVWFPGAPGLSFALDARPVAEPERIPGSARVTRWWLRRGADRCP